MNASRASALVVLSIAALSSVRDARAGTPKKPHQESVEQWIAGNIPIGDINHRFIIDCPKISDSKLGDSTCVPFALKFVVGKDSGDYGGIGKTVHQLLFPHQPGFTIKIAWATADTDLFGRGNYGNPTSIWYNVFLGYYEIDVSKKAWGRPFGYATADAAHRTLKHEDLVRIGKADWNHFSNQLYGVPLEEIKRSGADKVDMSAVHFSPLQHKIMGAREWDSVEMDGIRVVGPYRSKYDGKQYVDSGGVMFVWQYDFGTFDDGASPVHKSFVPTDLRGKLYLSFKEERDPATGEEIYKTFIFGGTNVMNYPDKAENARFLGLQMKALEHVIDAEKGLGFAVPCSATPAACAKKRAVHEWERLERLAVDYGQEERALVLRAKAASGQARKKLEQEAGVAGRKCREATEAAKHAAAELKKLKG